MPSIQLLVHVSVCKLILLSDCSFSVERIQHTYGGMTVYRVWYHRVPDMWYGITVYQMWYGITVYQMWCGITVYQMWCGITVYQACYCHWPADVRSQLSDRSTMWSSEVAVLGCTRSCEGGGGGGGSAVAVAVS